MDFTICTFFADMFNYFEYSILKKALQNGYWRYNIIDLCIKCKELSIYSADDTPYGGGHGMILKPTIFDHIDMTKYTRKFYMSPRGKVWTQQRAVKLLKQNRDGAFRHANESIFILCGRYEGVDQRILDYYNFEEISIGDYILCGGELAAMIVVESIVRLLPNVINSNSAKHESFTLPLLEHDLYTKPSTWRGLNVPEVLLNGHHKKIEQWKFANSLQNTYYKRFDLFIQYIVLVILVNQLNM